MDVSAIHQEKLLFNRYKVEKKIGDGVFCSIFKAYDIKGKKYVALKKYDNSKLINEKHFKVDFETKFKKMMEREASIMKELNHKNLIKLYEVAEDQNDFIIVMELAEGGELFDRIVNKGKFSEKDASMIIIQLITAVGYMHHKGFVHRDIKPENILFKTTADRSTLLLADFGLSREFNEKMMTNCGTIDYSAPELLKSKISKSGYGPEVDNWSIGVVTYVLMCGYHPFFSTKQDDNEVKKQIISGEYHFHQPHWDLISKASQNFISKLLIVDPQKRLSLKNALLHPWLKGDSISDINIYPFVQNSLQETISFRRWRCLGVTANAVHKLSISSPTLSKRIGINN